MKLTGIKIVSDGSVAGTRVYDATGKDVTAGMCIRGLQFQHCAGEAPYAVLTCAVSVIKVENIDGELTDEDIREITTLDSEARVYEKA